MNYLSHGEMRLEADQAERVMVGRLCERLHCLPDEARAISYADLCLLSEMWRADDAITQLKKVMGNG